MMADALNEHWDEADPRLQYLASYAVLALKSRNEKWTRLMSVEDNRQLILDFFEKPDAMLLIVTQNPGGHLLLLTSIPTNLRSKSIYFLKSKQCSLNKTDFGKILMCGDIYGDSFEQHCALVNEAMNPLLCSKMQESHWPAALTEDVQCEVHEIKSAFYRIKGDIVGKTLLPSHANVSYFERLDIDSLTSASRSDSVLRRALQGIEATTVQWNNQIQAVLSRTSETVFREDKLTIPETELQFWRERSDNLKDIFQQLSDPQVQRMAKILDVLGSTYASSFNAMFERLQFALEESNEMNKYLLPLRKHFDLLEQTSFPQIRPMLKPLLHSVCLTWVHAQSFSSSYLTILLRKICNLLVEMCCKYLDPARIFRGELEESVERVNISRAILDYFLQIYGDYKKNLRNYFPESEVRPWLFPESLVFEVYEFFLQRLEAIEV